MIAGYRRRATEDWPRTCKRGWASAAMPPRGAAWPSQLKGRGEMATYAFASPVQPGKLRTWIHYVQEMKTTHRDEMAASRQRLGLTREEVWLQQMPDAAY